jgi:hypothetical protein
MFVIKTFTLAINASVLQLYLKFIQPFKLLYLFKYLTNMQIL